MRSATAVAAAVALLLVQGGPCLADLSHSRAPPSFSEADMAIVRRNATLSRLIEHDPWLVRQALEAMSSTSDRSAGGRQTTRLPRIEPPSGSRDPDLQQLERASPEAAHDLFLLIKKAIGRKK